MNRRGLLGSVAAMFVGLFCGAKSQAKAIISFCTPACSGKTSHVFLQSSSRLSHHRSHSKEKFVQCDGDSVELCVFLNTDGGWRFATSDGTVAEYVAYQEIPQNAMFTLQPDAARSLADDLANAGYVGNVTMSLRDQIERKQDSIYSPLELLSKKLKDNEGYACSWHSVAACCMMNEGVDHATANRAAARFMKQSFGVDTAGKIEVLRSA